MLSERDLELTPLMESVCLLVSTQAASGGIALGMEVAEDFPALHADERAIRQILTNLVSNAVKFTPAGGHVALFAQLDESGAPVFGVADDGVGIAPEDHATVFENFGQGRHDAVIADRGTGLGLPHRARPRRSDGRKRRAGERAEQGHARDGDAAGEQGAPTENRGSVAFLSSPASDACEACIAREWDDSAPTPSERKMTKEADYAA